MSNLQTYYHFKLDFQKVDQHTGCKWLIHATKRRKDNQLQSLELPYKIVTFLILVRSRRWACLVTWFCYHLIVKPGNKTDAPSWPAPYSFQQYHGSHTIAPGPLNQSWAIMITKPHESISGYDINAKTRHNKLVCIFWGTDCLMLENQHQCLGTW